MATSKCNTLNTKHFVKLNENACSWTLAIKCPDISEKGLNNYLARIFNDITADYGDTDFMKISVSSNETALESVSDVFKPVCKYTDLEFINFIRYIRKKYPNFSLENEMKIRVTCILLRGIKKPNIESLSLYESHSCHMPTFDDKKSQCFVFYDFVSMQESADEHDYLDEDARIHKVNLCVAHQVCDECNKPCKSDIPKRCESCHGGEVQIFKEQVVKLFIDFLLKIKLPNNTNTITCIAHKSQKFHAQFIFKCLCNEGYFPKFIALNGTKIMYIEVSKGHQIRFIDSFNYINQNLSDFPKTFGFEDVISKWRFPHLFNSSDNQNYRGSIPDVKFFSPETMSNEKRAKFKAWHRRLRHSNYYFDFQQEIVEYCKNNVEILRRGCYEFRQKFTELTKVDPFIGKGIITIAGACYEFYKKTFLPKKQIKIIPTDGYRAKLKRTRESLEWLLICERTVQGRIMHIGNGHEYRLPNLGILVDGFDESSKTVYLYFDCTRYGCPVCFPSGGAKINKTKKLLTQIMDSDYIVIVMWACNFKRLKARNEKFLLNHHRLYSDALNPRDAFYGSRNENEVLFYKASENEEIRFVDVNSLYPFLNKHRKYPVGHPEILIGDECNDYLDEELFIAEVEGLVKCRVLPPRKLLYPVLPIHSDDKYTLIFPLCKKCTDISSTNCVHDDRSDREFTGTWVSEELKKAISMGYKITRIYEIWKYEVVEGLFNEYVNTFLKFKEEARGWHTEDDTVEKRDHYVEEYWRREGIRLDPAKMINNKGLRRIAEHSLNCLWGKFGQKVQNTTSFGNNGDELIEIVTSQDRELINVVAFDNSSYYYQWRYKEQYMKPSEKTSVPIAVYTTAYGRLELYKYLEKLGKRVLYCDTDSVIYKQPTNEEEIIKPGKFLGEMINELNQYGEGSYIREFVSSGPKYYSYVVVKPDESEEIVTKVGNVKLNSSNSRIFSHEQMKDLAVRSHPITYQSEETYLSEEHDVISKTVKTKVFKQSSTRFYTLDTSYPYGYMIK